LKKWRINTSQGRRYSRRSKRPDLIYTCRIKKVLDVGIIGNYPNWGYGLPEMWI